MSQKTRACALMTIPILALFATACAADEQSEGTSEAASSASSTDNAPQPTTATSSAAAAPEESESAAPGADAVALVGMSEVNSMMFTGNGSGTLAGTRFSTPDGSVKCHITVSAACVVNPHGSWPEEDRANDGSGATGDPSVIGWHEAAQAPFGEKPKTWVQQGTWPNTGTSLPMEAGNKIEVAVSFEGPISSVTCGVLDASTMVCVAGEHGFKVSPTAYENW
ncbi:hypothetical protein [uncultured Corynebacterium sp.]|uniref:hypothetical protein n=1 Tax=uncultured Corynebacterium sp. TaxID=159447 RepID=UPI002591B2CE|nr:hypothetical protein [uncultured Corynebacterium sp.]